MTDTPAADDDELERLNAAIAEFRARVAQSPDSLFPAHADALLQLGTVLAARGRHEEAFQAVVESVEIFRQLFEVEPDNFGVHLASALNSLSSRLSVLGRDEDARRFGDDAVLLAREAMKAQPEHARFVLISALINQAGRRLRAGEMAGTVAELSAAVRLFREAGDAGAPYLGPMIEALHRAAIAFTELALWTEAIDTRRLMVDLFPEGTPPAVVHLLALTLHQAALSLSRDGHEGDALACADEAYELAETLFDADTGQYRLFKAQALGSLAGRRHEAGRSQEALEPALQAVDLFHEEVGTDPQAAVPSLVLTLESLTGILTALGLEEQATVVAAQHDQLKGALDHMAEG